MLDRLKLVASTCENLFSKNNQRWEFIFEEKDLFKISENKKILKITSYTVLAYYYTTWYMWTIQNQRR